MSAMTAFMIAVAGSSLVFCLLMTRVQNRSARCWSAGDGPDNGASYGSGDGGSILGWFGGDHHSTSDNSGTSSDFGGGDGGGGD